MGQPSQTQCSPFFLAAADHTKYKRSHDVSKPRVQHKPTQLFRAVTETANQTTRIKLGGENQSELHHQLLVT